LAGGGRGEAAAAAYEEAAVETVDPVEAHELRRLAADQYFRCGRYDDGVAAGKRVIEAVGLRWPSGAVAALVQLVMWRLLLAVRGLRASHRHPARLSTRDRMRIDACCLIGQHVSGAALVGPLFSARGLFLALRSGDPQRTAVALANEIVHRAF